MRFGVLGPVGAWTDTGEPVRIPELKVRAVLADLLAHHGRAVSVDRLTDDLYADAPPANPAGAVQLKVSRLRRALDESEPGARALIVSRSPGYLLSTDALDADEFRSLVRRAQASADPDDRARLLTDALALWRGPAYADFADEDFTRSEILRLEEERLVAVEGQAEARLELGEHDLLVAELAEPVRRHPLRQRLRAAYMLALYRAGRAGDALATYADLRRRLVDELGLDPAPELVELQSAILRQDPGLAARGPGSNLPVPVDGLIGRDDAVREIREHLAGSRLVTLVGPGGVGKTRLAVAAATHELRPVLSGRHGTWLVELAALDRSAGPGEVAQAVLTVLGYREQLDRVQPARTDDSLRMLLDAVRSQQLLVALDNCEHVVAAVAEVAHQLLREAPGVRLLATSQEPLGVPGEVVVEVLPLVVPTDADDLGTSAARLFLERARLTPGPDNAAAIATICRGLDGVPLALELAAGRVRALGVHELAARLDDRLKLLSGGRRTGPARQQTLRAVIDWSWQLLTPSEQIVLRRLSAYADSFTLSSAERIAAVDQEIDVASAVLGLVDRSLVAAAGPRYRLLESVRAYAAEQLEAAAEADEVRDRHLSHYLELVERAEPHLHGGEQRAWLKQLDVETVELRHALEPVAFCG